MKKKKGELIKEAEKEIPIKNNTEISKDLEDKFKAFENNQTDFAPEKIEADISEGEPRTSAPKVNEPHILSLEEQLKVKMFLGFCSFILVGFNTFLLNFLRKTKVPYEKMILTDTEIAIFTPYVSGEEILSFLNKIPAWIIGIAHFEYMMFQKHNLYVAEFKENKKAKTNNIKKGNKNG